MFTVALIDQKGGNCKARAAVAPAGRRRWRTKGGLIEMTVRVTPVRRRLEVAFLDRADLFVCLHVKKRTC
jgi:hypothetical protein